jgi:hypothetical protein
MGLTHPLFNKKRIFMKFFQTFDSITEYNNFVANNEIEYPNISVIKGLDRSYFNNSKKVESIILEADFETYYDSAGTLNNVAINNGCNIKELIVDGQKVDVKYKPIVRTTYSIAGNRAIINEENGEIETAYSADTGGLMFSKMSAITQTIDFDFSDENEIGRDFDELILGSYLTDVEIYPKHGTLKSNNVQGIIALMDKVILEDLVSSGDSSNPQLKGTNVFIPIPQSAWTDNNKILIGPMLDVMSLFSLTDIILVGLDSNNKLKPIDTLCDILSCGGFNVEYYECSGATSARTVPFYTFSTEGKHSMKIELATNTLPPMMFHETCLTDISCVDLIGNLGALSLCSEKLKSINLPQVQYYNFTTPHSEVINRLEISKDCKTLDASAWGEIVSLKELIFNCCNAFVWLGVPDDTATGMCKLNKIVFNNNESVFADYDGINNNMTPDSLAEIFPTGTLEENGTVYMPNTTVYAPYKEYFESIGWAVLPLSQWNG